MIDLQELVQEISLCLRGSRLVRFSSLSGCICPGNPLRKCLIRGIWALGPTHVDSVPQKDWAILRLVGWEYNGWATGLAAVNPASLAHKAGRLEMLNVWIRRQDFVFRITVIAVSTRLTRHSAKHPAKCVGPILKLRFLLRHRLLPSSSACRFRELERRYHRHI